MRGVPWYKSWRKQYGRLFVVRLFFYKNDKQHRAWAKCICDCGNYCKVQLNHLRSGATLSCGCFQKEDCGRVHKIHGEAEKTTEWIIWSGIKQRCFNPNNEDYINYGGRGIKMLYTWAKSYLLFITWVVNNIGRRPGPEYSIDRINVDGHYYPGNLRWATAEQQANNKRKRKKVHKCL
jgi:hypothetical protein